MSLALTVPSSILQHMSAAPPPEENRHSLWIFPGRCCVVLYFCSCFYTTFRWFSWSWRDVKRCCGGWPNSFTGIFFDLCLMDFMSRGQLTTNFPAILCESLQDVSCQVHNQILWRCIYLCLIGNTSSRLWRPVSKTLPWQIWWIPLNQWNGNFCLNRCNKILKSVKNSWNICFLVRWHFFSCTYLN